MVHLGSWNERDLLRDIHSIFDHDQAFLRLLHTKLLPDYIPFVRMNA